MVKENSKLLGPNRTLGVNKSYSPLLTAEATYFFTTTAEFVHAASVGDGNPFGCTQAGQYRMRGFR